MQNLIRNVLFTLIFSLSFISSTALAGTINIDLNNFYLDSFIGTDTIAADGSEATLYEDDILVNDPYSGYEDGISLSQNVVSLSFTYDFTAYDTDEFYAWLFDGETGEEIGYWYIDTTESGTYSFNLTTLASSVTLLGLEFGISVDGDYGTQTVVISNVQLVTAVPVPATFSLLGIGVLVLAGVFRKKILFK